MRRRVRALARRRSIPTYFVGTVDFVGSLASYPPCLLHGNTLTPPPLPPPSTPHTHETPARASSCSYSDDITCVVVSLCPAAAAAPGLSLLEGVAARLERTSPTAGGGDVSPTLQGLRRGASFSVRRRKEKRAESAGDKWMAKLKKRSSLPDMTPSPRLTPRGEDDSSADASPRGP